MLIAFILGVFYFSGAVALAVNSEDWREQLDYWEQQGATLNSRSKRIPINLAVTAVWYYLSLLIPTPL